MKYNTTEEKLSESVERELLEEFYAWRDEIDQDHVCNDRWSGTFDLALGWFAGSKMFTHAQACNLAAKARNLKETDAR